jgi:integrating conjugative element protein (TIGR03759 family)
MLFLLSLALPAWAQDTRSTQHRTTQNQSTQVQQTAIAQARQWHLSVNEWDRYKKLLRGIDGYRSQKLDPITELGIRARSDAGRARYARKLARLEHERIQRVLAFQKAYDAAWKQLYPNEKPIQTAHITQALAASRRDAEQLGLDRQRRAVFVDAHGCPACVSTVKDLAASNTPMDIFVVDAAGNDQAIRAWAQRVGIKPKSVQDGEITLNHAPGETVKALQGQTLPQVITR